LSTFEHFINGAKALEEMHRVLRPGGAVLVSFEPVWTSARGHHLHHIPEVCRLIPAWAHLRWSSEEMRASLHDTWPAAAPMTLEQVIEWIYESSEINRVPAAALREMFHRSPFRIEWVTPLPDELSGAGLALAEELSRTL